MDVNHHADEKRIDEWITLRTKGGDKEKNVMQCDSFTLVTRLPLRLVHTVTDAVAVHQNAFGKLAVVLLVITKSLLERSRQSSLDRIIGTEQRTAVEKRNKFQRNDQQKRRKLVIG